MLPYNIVFISILILLIIQNKTPQVLNKILYVLIFSILVVFVGLRHEVGGDWFSYTNYILI